MFEPDYPFDRSGQHGKSVLVDGRNRRMERAVFGVCRHTQIVEDATNLADGVNPIPMVVGKSIAFFYICLRPQTLPGFRSSFSSADSQASRMPSTFKVSLSKADRHRRGGQLATYSSLVTGGDGGCIECLSAFRRRGMA
jgi:hypothetical protein